VKHLCAGPIFAAAEVKESGFQCLEIIEAKPNTFPCLLP
jgi:hypothetical protein